MEEMKEIGGDECIEMERHRQKSHFEKKTFVAMHRQDNDLLETNDLYPRRQQRMHYCFVQNERMVSLAF